MVESRREAWHEIVRRSEDAGADGLELNFGCPHGMCERGMGSAVGQQPAVTERIVSWVMEAAKIPVITKLTPNVTDITVTARAAEDAGSDILSLINTVAGMAVDITSRRPRLSTVIGGLSGPAIKPIALRMVWETYRRVRIPIIGMGGIMTADDAIEFLLAGATAMSLHRGG